MNFQIFYEHQNESLLNYKAIEVKNAKNLSFKTFLKIKIHIISLDSQVRDLV